MTIADDYKGATDRKQKLTAALSSVNSELSALGWDAAVERVAELQGRRTALALLLEVCTREAGSLMAMSYEMSQRARQREAGLERVRDEALTELVRYDEEVELFTAGSPNPTARDGRARWLSDRVRRRLERPTKDGHEWARALWYESENAEGFSPYVEYLRAEREKLRARYTFTDEEIAARSGELKGERARVEDLIARSVAPRNTVVPVGLV